MSDIIEKMKQDNGTLEYTLIEEEPIIGFNLWGERRICLPQLLRFVLPDFDINVIDRAVTDLQINCFQCNSEQMNLLHVNNIVPNEIVRCGLIRKSDAERLCKYLLQPNKNFDKTSNSKDFINLKSIDVIHTCFGEQRGILYPILYTSSDSKCLKCLTCENFFKTFEFVGHTHKLDEVSNTFHWGFDSNNWRLLLQIYADSGNTNITKLSEAKTILDRVKSMFYEEELKKINKFYMNIVWRPSRKLKLPNPPKPIILSHRPAHLKDGPVEFFKKNINRGLNDLKQDDINNFNYIPNVYLNPQDNVFSEESTIDDDDIDDYEDLVDKSSSNSDDLAMNIALQIKREAISRDPISLGMLNTYLNKKDINLNDLAPQETHFSSKPFKANHSPLVVAQATTSIPPQFLMLEALWSQLFRDIIHLTQLVQFNTIDERGRLIGQLIRCQDLFRSQWTNLAEENHDLKEKLLDEQKRRQDMEIIRDKMAISLKEITIEKDNLAEMVKRLESKYAELKSESNDNIGRLDDGKPFENKDHKAQVPIYNRPLNSCRNKFKRPFNYETESNEDVDSNDECASITKKQIRLNGVQDNYDI